MGSSLEEGKPWTVEYAKSGRALCRTCQKFIKADKLRLGKMTRSSRFDGLVARWNHADCIMKKPNRIKSVKDVEGLELLRWEDQQKIQKYVDRGRNKNSSPELEIAIEVSPTSRATCRHCKEKIMQGEVRISTKPDDPKVIIVAWHHVNCFLGLSPSINVESLYGWGSLPDSDQDAVLGMVKKVRYSSKDDHGGQTSKSRTSKVTQRGTRRARINVQDS